MGFFFPVMAAGVVIANAQHQNSITWKRHGKGEEGRSRRVRNSVVCKRMRALNWQLALFWDFLYSSYSVYSSPIWVYSLYSVPLRDFDVSSQIYSGVYSKEIDCCDSHQPHCTIPQFLDNSQKCSIPSTHFGNSLLKYIHNHVIIYLNTYLVFLF